MCALSVHLRVCVCIVSVYERKDFLFKKKKLLVLLLTFSLLLLLLSSSSRNFFFFPGGGVVEYIYIARLERIDTRFF